MTLKLLWDKQITWIDWHWNNQQYAIAVRTATTQGIQNRMTALKLHHPAQAYAIETAITAAAERLSDLYQRRIGFGVPEITVLRFDPPDRPFFVAICWCLNLTGGKRGQSPVGEFRFVISLYSELASIDDDDDVLTKAFDLHKTLSLGE